MIEITEHQVMLRLSFLYAKVKINNFVKFSVV